MNAALSINHPAAALWQALASTNLRRTATISAALMALLVLGHDRVWEPATGTSPGRAAASQPADPVAQFSETRIGQLLFVVDYGFSCRRVLFDNRTGSHREAGEFFCGPIGALDPPPAATTSDRLQGIRKTFQR